MLKVRLGLPVLLAPALLLSAAVGAAHAQDSNDVKQSPHVTTTTQAETVARQQTQDTTPQQGTQTQQQGTQTQQQTPSGSTTQPTKKPAPLTVGEKVSQSFRATFLSPTPYLTSAFSAGFMQLREDRLPHKDNGDEAADWGSRAARNFATRSTISLFSTGFYPALLRQDPRYEPSQSKSVGRRTLHAISRVFVTRDDDGKLEPNYSRFAGTMTGSALANIWEHNTPGHDRIGTAATFRRFAFSLTGAALSNIVFKEFGNQIIGIFRH
jgi:hypothetical protein